MGRYENFIPVLKTHTLRKDPSPQLIFENGKALALNELTYPFVKQMNGHLSLREIFLFLNSKNERISISQSLEILDRLVANQLLQHADHYKSLTRKNDIETHTETTNAAAFDRSYFNKERLIALIQKTTLFLHCNRQTAEEILKHSTVVEVKPSDKIIEMGSKSSDFFILLSGEIGVFRENDCLAQLHPLSVFGESAAVFNRTRNADVIAMERGFVLKINAAQLVDTHSLQTFESFKGLKSRLILNQTLASNPLFSDIPTDVLQLFISQCRVEKYSKEQWVLQQGEQSGEFYFILQGSVAIIRDGLPVTSLAEGDHFGEIAALFHQPRTASVMTETATIFLVLSRQGLFEVLASHLRLAISIEKVALARKNSTQTVFEIFEDSSDSSLDAEEITQSLSIDKEFEEVSQSHFDLEFVDFSQYTTDDDDVAS